MRSRNLTLLALAVAIGAAPLLLPGEAEFKGSDDQGSQAIAALAPDYQPWFKPLWEPPSGEVQSLLFSLQAALGAGLIGYYLGLRRGRQRRPEETAEETAAHAATRTGAIRAGD